MIADFVKIFLPALTSFSIGLIITPFFTDLLYQYRAWKKKSGKVAYDGKEAKVFNELHHERDTNTPRLGGVIIWSSVLLTVVGTWVAVNLFPEVVMERLNFLSREQTWLPLAALVLGGVVGFFDDLLEIVKNDGLSLKFRLAIVATLGLICGWWFYYKLEVQALGLPATWGGGEWELGWWMIPLFVVVTMAIYSGGIIDGLDGLAGGVFASIFTAYSVIAFSLGMTELAAFSAATVGASLAFLWFNIPPARFYMTETGSMALTLTLTVIVFLTDNLGGGYGVIVLPIVALPLFLTSGSVILQLIYKKITGNKLLRVAPLHHHFEAIGWPSYKVVMRYWVISAVSALLGTILAVIAII